MNQEELFRHLGIEQLTPMQQATAYAFDQPKDLVLLSPTGSGKTLAYLLPMVNWLDTLPTDQRGRVKALVLVPSRELAMQTEQVMRQMKSPFKVMSCYGGRAAMEEHRTMKALLPEVIVATPGRMNDHLRKQNFDACSVELLVIDEFDKSLELGFQEEMGEVIAQLPALKKRLLLSATDAEEIPSFVGQSFASLLQTEKVAGGVTKGELPFTKLNFLVDEPISNRLVLQKVLSPEKDKLETLFRLLCSLGQASSIIFVNYRESVERVVAYLKSKKLPCEAFHGGMEQPLREKALYKFRNGSCPVLVSTDLAARGLDISHVDHVIHYHLPVNEEAFTHRNGRTARWQSSGSSYLILHAEEQLPEYVPQEITCYEITETKKVPKSRWTTLYIGRGKKDKVNKIDIVGFLYKKGALGRDDVGSVDVMEHHAFVAVRREKVKQLLSLVQGEKLKGQKTVIEEAK